MLKSNDIIGTFMNECVKSSGLDTNNGPLAQATYFLQGLPRFPARYPVGLLKTLVP